MKHKDQNWWKWMENERFFITRPLCVLSANMKTLFFKISFSSHIIHRITRYTIYTTKWKLYKLKNYWGASHKSLFYVVSLTPLFFLASNLLFDTLMLCLKHKPKESVLTKHLNKRYEKKIYTTLKQT